MKLIHCADLHLDSPIGANLSPEAAKERKAEILATFSNLLKLAAESGVSAVLIAGDLFDSSRITKRTQQYVINLIRSYPDLFVFYLAGNHDSGSTLCEGADKPENLCTFDAGWRSYEFGEVTITGSEAPNPETLNLSPDVLNIVLMHGQEMTGSGNSADRIYLGKLKGKHIDYLALGHIHEYRRRDLDERGIACYSGCLEGRGFDECGKKGYVLLETTAKKIEARFVPFAKRELHHIKCDISGIATLYDLQSRAEASLAGIPARDLVKLELCGKVAGGVPVDTGYLAKLFEGKFYFLKIYNNSRLEIHPEDFEKDISLRGEFVRRVMASGLSQAEKERVLACGFHALAGEEPGI